MGIFCTVRAFLRFRGPEALWDTYMKHRGYLKSSTDRGARTTGHASRKRQLLLTRQAAEPKFG